MYQLLYLDGAEQKTIEKESEQHTIDIFRRIASVCPNNYKVVSIVNLEEQAQIKSYEESKQNYINDMVNQIQKTVKALIKKPYNSKNQLITKTIDIKHGFINAIENNIKQLYSKNDYCYIADNKIEIYIAYGNRIQINATQDYFMSAD